MAVIQENLKERPSIAENVFDWPQLARLSHNRKLSHLSAAQDDGWCVSAALLVSWDGQRANAGESAVCKSITHILDESDLCRARVDDSTIYIAQRKVCTSF